MSNDRFEYSISGLQTAVDSIQESVQEVQNNKTSFLSYIENSLEPNWHTTGGISAVGKLKSFVNGDFQKYINYLVECADTFENVVIPKVKQIDNS